MSDTCGIVGYFRIIIIAKDKSSERHFSDIRLSPPFGFVVRVSICNLPIEKSEQFHRFLTLSRPNRLVYSGIGCYPFRAPKETHESEACDFVPDAIFQDAIKPTSTTNEDAQPWMHVRGELLIVMLNVESQLISAQGS